MTDIAQLGFAIDTSGLRTGERSLNSYASTGERTERRMNQSVNTMNRDFLSLNRVIGAVGVTLAGLGVSSIGMDVKNYADEWKGLSSQIRQVTDSEADLVKVRKELLQVSQDTRTNISTTVNLYTELKRSTDDLGIGQAKQVQIVKTLNNLFTAGGKPISEMSGAIRQLTQGFASGVLRGDEFNSVAEGAPRIMDALTVSLGMTRGELREFAATGGITAEIMVKALESYSDTAQEMANQTAKTFAQSSVAARNNALEWVGSNKTINDSLDTLGATIEDFSEDLDSLADAGMAFITVVGAGMVISLGKTTAAFISQTAAEAASINAARASGIARATMGVSYAKAASVMATSEAALAASRVSNTKFTLLEFQAELNLEKQRLAAQITQIGRIKTATRMAEIQVASLAITKQLAREEGLLASATGAATGAQTAQAAATANLARATGVATASVTALGVATRFLLGPWGLLITAVGVAASIFLTSSDDSDEFTGALKKQEKAVDELTGKYKSLSTAQLASNYQSAQKVLIGFDQQRLDLNNQILSLENGSSRGRSTRINMLRDQLVQLNEAASPTEAKLKSLEGLLNKGVESLVPDAAESNDSGSSSKLTAAQKEYQKWLMSVTGYSAPLDEAADKIRKVNNAIASGLTITKSVAGYLNNATNELLEFNEASDGVNSFDSSVSVDIQSNIDELIKVQRRIDEIESSKRIDIEIKASGIGELAALEAQAKSLEQNISDIGGKDYSDFLKGLNGQKVASELRNVQMEIAATAKAMTEGSIPKLQATTRIEELTAQVKILGSTLDQPRTDDYNEWLSGIVNDSTASQLREITVEIQKVQTAFNAGALPEIVASEKLESLRAQAVDLGETLDTIGNKEYSGWLDGIVGESTKQKLQDIDDEIKKTTDAMNDGFDSEIAMEHIDKLEKRARELTGALSGSDMFSAISSSAIDGLRSIQSLSEQGSSEYAKLGIAVQAVTALQAVQAVVNQAAGTNPYESFAKMAAMVAALGSLGVSVSGLSSGFSDDSADNQESQGLDVWGEKSESISNSIDMTANATDKLVSINTNMLSALESLADDISSAVTLSIRDVDSANLTSSVSIDENFFDGISSGILGVFNDALSILGGNFITGIISNAVFDKIGDFLGGSSSTTDSGIQIAGGTLAALATDADVDAYIDTKYKKWKFGSTKRRTDYADLDDASAQFSLVFASLADSVYEGATALGLSSEAVTDAVNAFEIETFQISLKGLSTEEQAAEVEAVFASIFDDLALSIVPYLSDFQELGEGYGETLARIATEVGIAEVLVDQLGITIGDKLADPEMYITIANNLSTLAGGIDDFADKTASFIDSFAPDSVKLDIYTDAMIDALSGVGLALPSTTEEFFNLLQGLDATTDAGQEQVATLLNLTDTASEYYDLLDSTVGDFNDSLETLTTSIMSTIDDMFGITYEDALTSLDDALLLARAGSFDSALGLDLTSLSGDESDFSSLADFNIAQARTGNKLADLAALTGETMTTADYALNESIEQTSLLKSLKEGIAKANELLTNQNRLQAESADTLDTINNKTEYA